ncbi:hypothetical protein VPHD239_0060 [Vibrio phage D239]
MLLYILNRNGLPLQLSQYARELGGESHFVSCTSYSTLINMSSALPEYRG